MPTVAEFQTFWDEHGLELLGVPETLRSVRERWSLKADRMAYYEWLNDKSKKSMAEKYAPYSRTELVNMMTTTNYKSPLERAKLVDAMQRRLIPWIPVGSDWNDVVYRLRNEAYGLLADKDDPRVGRPLTPESVLGVNINVQTRHPASRRLAGLSEESTTSNVSDDSETGEFVFHHLGTLEYWSGKPEELQNPQYATSGLDIGRILRRDEVRQNWCR